jgi:hypothetical protein
VFPVTRRTADEYTADNELAGVAGRYIVGVLRNVIAEYDAGQVELGLALSMASLAGAQAERLLLDAWWPAFDEYSAAA